MHSGLELTLLLLGCAVLGVVLILGVVFLMLSIEQPRSMRRIVFGLRLA